MQHMRPQPVCVPDLGGSASAAAAACRSYKSHCYMYSGNAVAGIRFGPQLSTKWRKIRTSNRSFPIHRLMYPITLSKECPKCCGAQNCSLFVIFTGKLSAAGLLFYVTDVQGEQLTAALSTEVCSFSNSKLEKMPYFFITLCPKKCQ